MFKLHNYEIVASSPAHTFADQRGQMILAPILTLSLIAPDGHVAEVAAEAKRRVDGPLAEAADAWRRESATLKAWENLEASVGQARREAGEQVEAVARLAGRVEEALVEGVDFVKAEKQHAEAVGKLALLNRRVVTLERLAEGAKAKAEADLADALERKRKALVAELQAEADEAREQLEASITGQFPDYVVARFAVEYLNQPGRHAATRDGLANVLVAHRDRVTPATTVED